MAGAKKSTWVGGTALACVVLVGASWTFMISPALASASETRDQATSARAQNDALELQITGLQGQFKKLDEYRAQLAEARSRVPSTADLAQYVRELGAAAEKRDVTIIALTPSPPQEFTPAVVTPPPAAAPTADGSTPAAEPTPAATPAAPDPNAAAAAAAAAMTKGLVAIPISIEVLGSFEGTQAFLNDVQTSKGRLFLVTALTGTSQPDGAASAGRPATKAGDQDLIIAGYTYVMPDDSTALPPTATPTEKPKGDGPATSNNDNPLKPVSGH